MKRTTINKLTGLLLAIAGSFVLFGAGTEVLAANVTASAHNSYAHNEITSPEVPSLVSFNLDHVEATTDFENQSSSGTNKWIAGIYYLIMIHLIFSFILADQGEEA